MALATNSTPGSIVLAGDLTGVASAPELRSTGVIAGSYGPVNLVVDSKGRIVWAKTSTWPDIESFIDIGSSAARGIVQICDGLTVSDGVVSLNAPDATYISKGLISISHSFDALYGNLVANHADTDLLGAVTVGSGLSIDGSGVLSVNGANVATTSTTGVVKIGAGLSIDGTGNLTLNAPIATTSTTGVVKIGTGLSIDGSGVLSASAVPVATTSTTGVVKIGTGLSIDGTGNLTLAGNVTYVDQTNTYTHTHYFTANALTYSATVNWDGNDAVIYTLTATNDFTLANPTNMMAGRWYHIIITTTSNTHITYDTAYKFRTGSNTQPLTSNGVSILSCYMYDNATVFCIMQPDFI